MKVTHKRAHGKLSLLCVHVHSPSSDWQRSPWVLKHLKLFTVCSFMCLSSRDIFIFSVRVIHFYSYFSIIHTVVLFFPMWFIQKFFNQKMCLMPRKKNVEKKEASMKVTNLFVLITVSFLEALSLIVCPM